jgi:multiple sugar transport system ATP-binding protein
MNTRTSLKQLVSDIKSTTIYVTADSSEALSLADRLAVLDQGKFVQVDRPFDMYFHPKTTLVADFFGVLGMNFLKGRMKKGKFIFQGIEINKPFHIENDTAERIEGDEVLLGIRPEDISFSKKPSDGSLKVEVELIQAFPPKADLVCSLNGKTVHKVAFIKDIMDIAEKDILYLKVPETKTYLFDPGSGELIV